MRLLRLCVTISICLSASMLTLDNPSMAAPPAMAKADQIFQHRLELFQRIETMYGIPWHYLAAIDQYERSILKRNKKNNRASARLTAISIPPAIWSGLLNPDENDTNVNSIAFFGGLGVDGNGDGKADQNDDLDVLAAIIRFYAGYGFAPKDFRNGLSTYYKRERTVKTIDQFSAIYVKYQTLGLTAHRFPIPKQYSYSYLNNWGVARGWGGRRIHEGTDIFADYGTPVLSTGYGIIEVMGWNRFGGWRIGLRDMDNVYHYFAHLSAFRKGLKVGDIVKPGQVIGYVGSSGYGKPGTSGKFPAHLHYGMYKDSGRVEWAFDPYPRLAQWERQMYRKKKSSSS